MWCRLGQIYVKKRCGNGEGAPPNIKTNTNIVKEAMWKKGRGAAKYKYKYVWRSDVEKGKGRREEPKRWWHATTAAPPQSQRLGDWSWIILNYLETDRRISRIIRDYPSWGIQNICNHFLTKQISLVLNCWQASNLIQDNNESKSLILTTEWDNPRAWYIIES